jgi:hypothetical protein
MVQSEYLSLLLELALFMVGSFAIVYGILFLIYNGNGFKKKPRKEQITIFVLSTLLFVVVVSVIGSLLAYDSISVFSEDMRIRYNNLLGTTYEEVYYDMQVVLQGYNDMYSFTVMLTRVVSTVIGSYIAYAYFVSHATLNKK